ncbi:alanine racemase [Falsigemmobacter faecalis]|uniref:Alanine racemase n=1 Tax=Falsigemmobacter faecalis TaxID=2488730 RepID=A0A3P3DIC2_9RHOB|nr:alanine racemase [Falsigemmobacter faecalis]RRH73963.1 alanine racemase [Falsigemmobacter faecalis]
MATGILSIDLAAICANWRAMDRVSAATTETSAVVKADAYGLGAGTVARALAGAGARRFFVAVAEEGAQVRQALGDGFEVNVLGGHCSGDTALIRDFGLTPMLNSVEQVTRHFENLPGHAFGIQLDTGMNRLGLEPDDWAAIADIVLDARPTLLMSHLACADAPDTALNRDQLETFHTLTDGLGIARSLAATGGILLGPDYHFDVTRPGVGLYGGLPFDGASPVVTLSLPVIQHRLVQPGEYVGYSLGFRATQPTRVATIAAGYADGLSRALSGKATLWAGDVPCPLLGRVSMDLMTVDVSHLDQVPETLDILGPHQGVDALGGVAGTIGYEILTSLGHRYARRYLGAA